MDLTPKISKPSDEKIRAKWSEACKLYGKGSLAKRVAGIIVEELEAAGVTEADIDRLYPLTPIQLWIRDNFIEPGAA